MDEMEKKLVGTISHFYGKIMVAVVDLVSELSVGDEIEISGPSTNVHQTVESMQIEHSSISKAKKGDSIGLKVADKVKENDAVYKLVS